MLEAPTLPNRLLEVAPAVGDAEEDDPNPNPDVVPPVADDDNAAAAPNPEDFPAVLPTLAKPPPKPTEDPFPMDEEAEVVATAPNPVADPKPKTFLVLGAAVAAVSVGEEEAANTVAANGLAGFSVEVDEEAANTVEANGLLLVALAVGAAVGVVDANPVVRFLSVEGRVVSAAAPVSLLFVAAAAVVASAGFGAAAAVATKDRLAL